MPATVAAKRASTSIAIAVALCLGSCAEKFSASGPSTDGGGPDAAPTTDIPQEGMLLWMQGDHGVTQQSGRVSTWDDQSPLHLSATQDVATLQPLFLSDGFNGRPAVLFDGNDDFLQLPSGFSDLSAGISLFGVFETDGVDGCTAMFEASNGSEIDDISFGRSDAQLNYEVFDTTNQDVAYPTNVPVQFSIVHHPDETVEIRRDGLFGARGGFAPPDSIERQAVYVGKTLYGGCASFNGKIGEILVYDHALPDNDVVSIETYLQSKYSCCSR